jgi:hypothetical protein
LVVAAGVFMLVRPDTKDSAAQPAGPPRLALARTEATQVGAPVRLHGELRGSGSKGDTTLMLMRKRGDRWVEEDRQRRRADGSYAFVKLFDKPATMRFRTIARQGTRTLATSPVRPLTVAPSRASGRELLPDLGAKKLTDCARSEQPCFRIDSSPVRTFLRFPMVTANVGAGPVEIHGYRSTRASDDWVGAMATHYSDGGTRFTRLPRTKFYWAGDGHRHWHIRDFDYYDILNAEGTQVARGEKHGFCFEDNTTYRDWASKPEEYPGVPQKTVYAHETSCGSEDPYATKIVHGLSVGWGDTYPTTLPDQGLDVTDLPDGTYTVRVIVDGQHMVKESNEDNNIATVKIELTRSKVTVLEETATGL